MTEPGDNRPLAGVTVLDLTRFHPGCYLSRVLADLGAEVIKVESPKGSPMRARDDADYSWIALHHSMRSMVLDLRAEGAGDVLTRLASVADIVVESNAVGRMDRDGIGYEALSSVNPRLIWCSLTAYGNSGPYADRGGHEINFLAHTGMLGLLTPEGSTPNQPGVLLAAEQGALWGVIGVLSALERRHRTGLGGFVDLSITDATMWLMSEHVTRARQGAAHWPDATPGRTSYRCSDGRWLTVASIEPRTWQALVRGLGLDDLADNVDGAGLASDEVQARLAAAVATQPSTHWMEALAEANVTVLQTADDLPLDPHVVARGAIAELPRSDGGPPDAIVTAPLRLSGADTSAEHLAPPPEMGEATDEILARAGYDADGIAGLRTNGVVA